MMMYCIDYTTSFIEKINTFIWIKRVYRVMISFQLLHHFVFHFGVADIWVGHQYHSNHRIYLRITPFIIDLFHDLVTCCYFRFENFWNIDLTDYQKYVEMRIGNTVWWRYFVSKSNVQSTRPLGWFKPWLRFWSSSKCI